MKRTRTRILAAFDFSEPSASALTEAIRMARTTAAELVILHVFADGQSPAEYGWRGGPAQREHDHHAIIELLEHEADNARSVQVVARVRTASGDPTERILEAAALENASALFLGADAHEGFVGALLGRVAVRVVREASVPVFVVRRRAAASPTDSLPRRRIVAGFDFSRASTAAVDAALALAKDTGGEVRIVHVLPTPRSFDAEEMARRRSRLEEIAADAAASGVVATVTLAFGDPATALVAETEQEKDSVVCVGTHSRSRFSRLLLGSVTESVLRMTDSTVLVAHATPVAVPHATLPLAQDRRAL